MAIKRITAVFVLLLLVPILSLSSVYAADPIDAKVRIEQVESKLPDVKAYFYADDAGTLSKDDVKADLDGKALTVEDLRKFPDSGEGIAYLFLVDTSTSIKGSQMKATKAALTSFSDTLKENEKMLLLPFGERVEIRLAGGENKEAREKAIDALTTDQNGTAFYDAISKAVSIANGKSESLPNRVVAIAISDGVDYNAGGYTNRKSTMRSRKAISRSLPWACMKVHYRRMRRWTISDRLPG
jgi:Mg-chelatase subunit ChlD